MVTVMLAVMGLRFRRTAVAQPVESRPAYLRECMHICLGACTYVRMKVCVHACVCVCMYGRLHVCMCVLSVCLVCVLSVFVCACVHVRMCVLSVCA